jgi:hypothetical protein
MYRGHTIGAKLVLLQLHHLFEEHADALRFALRRVLGGALEGGELSVLCSEFSQVRLELDNPIHQQRPLVVQCSDTFLVT